MPDERPVVEQIAYYLERFRVGDPEDAFFRLLEIDGPCVPALVEAFRRETVPETRRFLLKVIWQRREPTCIPFLGEMLRNADPEVWKQALDGLVTFGSPEALDALRSARDRPFPTPKQAEEFRIWIDEAIEQIRSESR